MSARKRLLIGFAALLYYSGLVALARWWIQGSRRHLVILNYHRASAGNLRRHIRYLQRYYHIIPIEDALETLYISGRARKQESQRIPLVLTFDDGYQDNYTDGFALAQELQVPFTIYLVPGYIESGDYFWWFEGKRLTERSQMREVLIEGTWYHLDRPAEQHALANLIDTRLRYAPSVAERETFLASMRSALMVPSIILEEDAPRMPLTWKQVHEMQESGLISFGGHTMHHPILAYLNNNEERQHEIVECHAVLEQQLGRKIRTFAYPVGQAQHIGNETCKAVRHAGFTWAVTTHYGFNTAQTNPLKLRRIEVDVDQHWLIVAAAAAGLWGLISRLRWIPVIRKSFTNSR